MTVQLLVLRRGDEERRAYFALAHESELASSAAPPESFLSEAECKLLGSLRFAQKRQGFLLGRLAAKRALGAMMAEPDVRHIDIRAGVFGQPLVCHPHADHAHVTVSHAHGIAVALAYPREWPMGLDLEGVGAEAATTILGELQLSAAEQAWLASELVSAATACGVLWTAREALGKSMQIGLNCPLGILALDNIEPVVLDAAATPAWAGRYNNFPQSRCLSQARDGRVLSIAMPAEIELHTWPHWHG